MTTILVIDDQEDLRHLFKFLLRGMGCQFLEAANGLDGQLLALKHQPDVILLDIMMPILDGHDTCRHLRDAGYDGVVVLMSAFSPLVETEKALKVGATAYLQKPITSVMLQDQLNKLGIHTPLHID